MNTKRIAVLSFAGAMAIAAALLARAALGGGTPKVEAKVPPPVPMSEILVADTALIPGHVLTPDQVRWQKWPSASVDPSFIAKGSAPSIKDAVKGTVVRTPLVAGQPVTTQSIVHGDAAGFMAAMLMPGMRAVSIAITTDSDAGGFILPNDHVDLLLARKLDGNQRVVAKTLLTDIRVLAVDQTFKQTKDTKTVIGKTATLELTPAQAQKVEAAENLGTLALSLRPLADGETPVVASNQDEGENQFSVIRYGAAHSDQGVAQEGKPQ